MMFKKNSMVTILVASFAFIVFGLTGPVIAHAATSPSLGTAATFSILAGSEVTNSGATTISGSVGISPGIGVAPHYSGFGTVTLGGTVHDANATALAAQGDKNTAYTALAAQGCGTTYVGAFKELAGLTLTPGVYCADSFHLTGGTLTLSGTSTDVWVFKSSADLVISGGAPAKIVFSGGGLECNVWWRVVSSATFDAGSSLVGNILADTSITLASGASLSGRAFARTAEVTLVANSITAPNCTAATSSSSSSSRNNTITVIKNVINDNGGTARFTDFPLFLNGNRVASGESIALDPGIYTITETNLPNYTTTFTGNCDASGKVNHGGIGTHNDVCTVVNNDVGAVPVAVVPPLIDVVKVPSPLSLPNGAGEVTYTYTVRNIGTVPMTDITMVGDTCSPIALVNGDTNNDSKLDVSETWIYTCSTTLSETHTNTVVATGHANGLTAIDVASATVVVGLPIVPPLIHITKVPNPLALPNGAGIVTYTNKVTNPGTVALSNVTVTDDLCNPVTLISGDANGDSMLDTSETWVYTCQTKLIKTTTNTVLATGVANGLIATDFSLATVVVAVPKLPNTGADSGSKNIPWNIMLPVGIFTIPLAIYFLKKKYSAES